MGVELTILVLLAIVLVYYYTKDKKIACITEDGDIERLGLSLLAGAAAYYGYTYYTEGSGKPYQPSGGMSGASDLGATPSM